MNTEWLYESVRSIVSVCMLISIIECVIDDSTDTGGFRMFCSASVAAAVIRMAAEGIQKFR